MFLLNYLVIQKLVPFPSIICYYLFIYEDILRISVSRFMHGFRVSKGKGNKIYSFHDQSQAKY